MNISTELEEIILNADSKVLATTGPHGLNVVPVSSVFVRDQKIWLVNYFFSKTADNLRASRRVVLTCWSGFSAGCQIKGEAAYIQEGADFEGVKEWAAEEYPDRTVQAIVKITPEEAHDVIPGS